jgi:hypothetical protein
MARQRMAQYPPLVASDQSRVACVVIGFLVDMSYLFLDEISESDSCVIGHAASELA